MLDKGQILRKFMEKALAHKDKLNSAMLSMSTSAEQRGTIVCSTAEEMEQIVRALGLPVGPAGLVGPDGKKLRRIELEPAHGPWVFMRPVDSLRALKAAPEVEDIWEELDPWLKARKAFTARSLPQASGFWRLAHSMMTPQEAVDCVDTIRYQYDYILYPEDFDETQTDG